MVTLNADLLELATEKDKHWASVRFSGMVREAPGGEPVGRVLRAHACDGGEKRRPDLLEPDQADAGDGVPTNELGTKWRRQHPNRDVGSEAEVERLVAVARARLGRIDAIVSNAGIGVFEPMPNTTLESWNRVLATNLTATFLLAKAAAADLKGARGVLVTIASTRAHMSEPGTLAYSASKGGLVALTHALAMTLAPDVRVNCVSPGWIDSGKHGPLEPADHAQHPVGRVGRPDDVAAAVAYLLSEEAGFVTGAELIVDGGMTRKMIYT